MDHSATTGQYHTRYINQDGHRVSVTETPAGYAVWNHDDPHAEDRDPNVGIGIAGDPESARLMIDG